MTPDDLRSLADALDSDPARGMAVAADYLRACADVQPVPVVPVDWTGRLKEAVKHIGYANVEKWYRLGGEDMIEQAKSDAVTAYATLCEALESLAAAPSAPQAEPDDELVLGEPDILTPEDVRRAVPQAEPKRDWSTIDAAIREYLDGYEQIGEDDAGADACYTPTERERDLIYDAINGLLADESFVAAISAPQAEQPIDLDAVAMQQMRQAAAESTWMPAEYSGSDWIADVCRWLRDGPPAAAPQAEPKREPLSDERITKGEYVLATKFSDGDPGDHWGVGFYDRLENGRHYIVDRAGQQIRGGGFRRAGRITVEVGIWLLSAAKSLEASPPGTVNLWTMLTERAHGIGGSDE